MTKLNIFDYLSAITNSNKELIKQCHDDGIVKPWTWQYYTNKNPIYIAYNNKDYSLMRFLLDNNYLDDGEMLIDDKGYHITPQVYGSKKHEIRDYEALEILLPHTPSDMHHYCWQYNSHDEDTYYLLDDIIDEIFKSEDWQGLRAIARSGVYFDLERFTEENELEKFKQYAYETEEGKEAFDENYERIVEERLINHWFNAIEEGDIKYLKDNVSDKTLSYKKSGDKSSLVYAVECGKLDVIKFLIGKGMDINEKSSFITSFSSFEECSLLHVALKNHQFEICEFFLDKGFKIDRMCFYMTAIKPYSKSFEYLLSYSKDINFTVNNGDTLLMIICRNNSSSTLKEKIKCVELLLDEDVDINLKNNKNETALTIALTEDKHEIVKILLSHGAKLPIDHICCNFKEITKDMLELIKNEDNFSKFIEINKNNRSSNRSRIRSPSRR